MYTADRDQVKVWDITNNFDYIKTLIGFTGKIQGIFSNGNYFYVMDTEHTLNTWDITNDFAYIGIEPGWHPQEFKFMQRLTPSHSKLVLFHHLKPTDLSYTWLLNNELLLHHFPESKSHHHNNLGTSFYKNGSYDYQSVQDISIHYQ